MPTFLVWKALFNRVAASASQLRRRRSLAPAVQLGKAVGVATSVLRVAAVEQTGVRAALEATRANTAAVVGAALVVDPKAAMAATADTAHKQAEGVALVGLH